MIKKILKLLYLLCLPILGIYCLCMYCGSELIVDKVHYGIFMLAMLILMGHETNNHDKMKGNIG